MCTRQTSHVWATMGKQCIGARISEKRPAVKRPAVQRPAVKRPAMPFRMRRQVTLTHPSAPICSHTLPISPISPISDAFLSKCVSLQMYLSPNLLYHLVVERQCSEASLEGCLKNEKRAFISDIWGKRGATYGEKGLCRRIKMEPTSRLHARLRSKSGARGMSDRGSHGDWRLEGRGGGAIDGVAPPKREFISDMWGKRGAACGEKGVCRRIQKKGKQRINL